MAVGASTLTRRQLRYLGFNPQGFRRTLQVGAPRTGRAAIRIRISLLSSRLRKGAEKA